MNQMASGDNMGLIGNEFNPLDRWNTNELMQEEEEVKRGFQPLPSRPRGRTDI